VDGDRPTPHRFAARIYEDMNAIALAAEAALRAAERGPADAEAWARVGRLRLRLMDREGALEALERARDLQPTVEALLDLALAYHLAGDVGGEVSACEQATALAPEDGQAWSRCAHALARTDRVSDCLQACERALELGADPEVSQLAERMRAIAPRELAA
jgi:tetratricopeptide (TPR) repeat protein